MTELTRRSFLSLLVATPALVKLPGVVLPPPPPAPAPVPPVRPSREQMLQALGALRRQRVEKVALPFGPDPMLRGFVIPPGRIARMSARVQRVYRPERLIVTSTPDELELLELLGISSAGEPQIDASIGSVPASLFGPCSVFNNAEDPFAPRLDYAAIEPAQEIVICARNTGDAPAFFHPTFIGTTVRELGEEEARLEREQAERDALEFDAELGDTWEEDLDEEDLDEGGEAS